MNRSRAILTAVSAIACGFMLVILPVSFHLDPWQQGIAINPSFHVGFLNGGILFYSHAQPYLGSMMGIGGPDTHEVLRGWHSADGDYDFGQDTFVGREGEIVDRKKFCTLPGVYFRLFQVHGEARVLWTLMLSLWFPILLLAVMPAIWMFRRGRLLLTHVR